jgi:Zn-dependent peptidase ImmA (M78 family)/transcriptional regulator with XRE-family HTH domain
MRGEPAAGVQPKMLKWARESIGKPLADVARALKRPAEEIDAWERGDKAPTYVQLERLAYEVYKRPLAAFFLPEPPQEKGPESDFRTLPEEDLQMLLPDTYLKIRQARAYQAVLRELFSDVSPSSNPIWRAIELSENASVEKQAARLRTLLGISLEEQGKWSNDDLALKQWRFAVESGGVFVFKNALAQKSISSFCLSDEQFPIIYLNNSTTKTRQIFSLFHELAHILLRMNGLSKSGENYIEELPKREQKIEKFCNALAAEILIPAADFARRARPPSKNLKTCLSDNLSKEIFSRYYQGRLTKDEASEYLGIKLNQFGPLEEKMLQGMEA